MLWLAAPSSVFKASNAQQCPSHIVSVTPTMILLPPSSIFKDRWDYIELPQIIQENLLISK